MLRGGSMFAPSRMTVAAHQTRGAGGKHLGSRARWREGRKERKTQPVTGPANIDRARHSRHWRREGLAPSPSRPFLEESADTPTLRSPASTIIFAQPAAAVSRIFKDTEIGETPSCLWSWNALSKPLVPFWVLFSCEPPPLNAFFAPPMLGARCRGTFLDRALSSPPTGK